MNVKRYWISPNGIACEDNEGTFVRYEDYAALEARCAALASLEAEALPEWTNEQCLEFLSIAFRHAEIKGDLQLDDIRLGVKMVNAYRAAPPAPASVPDDVSGPLAHAYKELTPTFMRNHIDVFELYGIYPDGSAGIQAMRIALDGMNRRAAMLQGAESRPELTVWYGSMPESNGKANWTAILHRKGEGRCMDGFTIDRSEYPGRVLYAADRVRYLIGEKSERPRILDYDADAHSGYVKPGNPPVIPDGWVACSERMPEREIDVQVYCSDKKEQMVGYMERNERDSYFRFASLPNGGGVYCQPSHWMPLPAAPQQEAE